MENPDGRVRKPKSLPMGVQISCGIYPEVPTQDLVRAVATPPWGSVSQVSGAEGEPHLGGTPDARPCASTDEHTAKIQCIECNGVLEREEQPDDI